VAINHGPPNSLEKLGPTGAMGDGAVNEVVEKVVRADVSRLLHNEYLRQAICIDCLAAAIPAGSPPFTHIEIRGPRNNGVARIFECPTFIPVPPL